MVTVACKELRDDKRSLLLTIRALNLAWYRAGLVTLTVSLYFLTNRYIRGGSYYGNTRNSANGRQDCFGFSKSGR